MDDFINNECGGHRVQRVPNNENRGRVHTSTVIVSCIPKEQSICILRDHELELSWFSGSGAGGQHRNKHQNCLRLRHIPSGITVTCQGRERQKNLREARDTLLQRLLNRDMITHNDRIATQKQLQTGSGMRGDKIRTYQFQRNLVKNHRNDLSSTCKEILEGNFKQLWLKS